MLVCQPSFSDIKCAHRRIAEYIVQTPVMTSKTLDKMAGCRLFFKCENFQKAGAFKIRGATNAILSFQPEERTNGFVCHSSGNHGQAVALASRRVRTKAYIIMPKNASESKIAAVKSYGAEVVFCESNEASREKTCAEVMTRTATVLIHPFNDYEVIAGQATVAAELLAQVENLNCIIAPVGGGGLAAGTSIITHHVDPNIAIYLGEPKAVDDAYQSLKAGRIIPNKTANTIADGLKTTIGTKNFEIINQHVEEVFTVTEQEIIMAMKLIWERMKIIIEPSCAVPLASVLKHKKVFEKRNVGIILTGGNVDLNQLPF